LEDYDGDRYPDLWLNKPPVHPGRAIPGTMAWRLFERHRVRRYQFRRP